jgi:hypothetical protein
MLFSQTLRDGYSNLWAPEKRHSKKKEFIDVGRLAIFTLQMRFTSALSIILFAVPAYLCRGAIKAGQRAVKQGQCAVKAGLRLFCGAGA